jgi:hypothetical protein
MAGDWIKMRGNLWDDPRIAHLCDLTDQSEAAVVGGLYWLWASADQHSENGAMPGLSVAGINRKTGIKGFGEALVSVGWLVDRPDGIFIVRFEEHNGSSAKRRCTDAQRKSAVRNMSASDADKIGNSVELEKEKEKSNSLSPEDDKKPNCEKPQASATKAGAVSIALRAEGLASVGSSNPKLRALLDAGAEVGMFVDAYRQVKATPEKATFPYVMSIVETQMAQAARIGADATATKKTSEVYF